MTGTRILPVVEGQDGGGDEMNEEYLRTDQCFSMLDIYVYNLNKFRNWLFTSMCFPSVTLMCYLRYIGYILLSHFQLRLF